MHNVHVERVNWSDLGKRKVGEGGIPCSVMRAEERALKMVIE